MSIPAKCMNCEHAITIFENVHKGWMRFQYESVTRCDCHPAPPKVGCVAAESVCVKKEVGK